MINFQNRHGSTTVRAAERIIPKAEKEGITPVLKRPKKFLLFRRNTSAEFLFLFMMLGIDAVVTKHFKVFFRDMNNKTFNEIESGNALLYSLIIFVSGVMEGNIFSIIFVNT